MSFLIQQLKVGQPDMAGNRVEEIIAMVSTRFAVYRAAGQVKIQFADDDTEGMGQRAALAPLLPLRTAIEMEISRLGESRGKADANAYGVLQQQALGRALLRGLQGDISGAEAQLTSLQRALTDERGAYVRTQHLVYAVVALLAIVYIAIVIAQAKVAMLLSTTRPLWIIYPQAICFGALGAIFSIALQIRERKINLDVRARDNLADAMLRVFIGSVSAVVAIILLKSGLANFSLGSAPMSNSPEARALVAFVAGFLERKVADYLEGFDMSKPGTAQDADKQPAKNEKTLGEADKADGSGAANPSENAEKPVATEAGRQQPGDREEDEQEPPDDPGDDVTQPVGGRSGGPLG